ncbi:MAG: hypothetical protein KatS3mg112_1315 [Thermogutta sp.]|nr:MAG: hypothetical protein KatS3mg112_1315 [Thermogutta sp.]
MRTNRDNNLPPINCLREAHRLACTTRAATANQAAFVIAEQNGTKLEVKE